MLAALEDDVPVQLYTQRLLVFRGAATTREVHKMHNCTILPDLHLYYYRTATNKFRQRLLLFLCLTFSLPLLPTDLY